MQAIQLLAIASGFVAAMTLFGASLAVPWNMQSWDGETNEEKRFRRRRQIMKWIGIPSAVLSATCQVAVTVWPNIVATAS